MSGARVFRMAAAARATRLGHVLGPWDHDTHFSVVAECSRCGALAAVDVELLREPMDLAPIYGRATQVACKEVPHGNKSGNAGQVKAA